MYYIITNEKLLNSISTNKKKDTIYSLFKNENCIFINELLKRDNLKEIDEESKIKLIKLNNLILEKRNTKSVNNLTNAALFAGIYDATLHYANIIKVIIALKHLKNKNIEIISSDLFGEILYKSMKISGFSNVKLKKLFILRLFNFTKNLRNIFIALISIALLIFYRQKNKKILSNQSFTLVELSPRIYPYIELNSNKNYIFYSERLKKGAREILAKSKLNNTFFLDHSVIDLHILLQWFLHYISSIKNLFELNSYSQCEILNNIIKINYSWRLLQSLSFKSFFDKHKINLIINHSDNSPFERLSIYYARYYGIKECCIQHGLFTEPMNLDGILTNNYFVWGKSSEIYLKKLRGNDINVSVIGQPRFCELAQLYQNSNAINYRVSNHAIKILYLTRSNSTETSSFYENREKDFLNMIFCAWSENLNNLTIKPHPRALSLYEYKKLIKFSTKKPQNLFITIHDGIEFNLMNYDLIITTGGTSILDSIVASKPCIFINPPYRDDINEWKKYNLIKYVDYGDVDKLHELLRRAKLLLAESKLDQWHSSRNFFLDLHINFNNFIQQTKDCENLENNIDNLFK